jgi:multicomponent Na+:H+ antiporter subunit E
MRRIAVFLVSLILWYLMSWPYDFRARAMDWQPLVIGVLVSAAAAAVFGRGFAHRTAAPAGGGSGLHSPVQGSSRRRGPSRWLWALVYLPVLFWAMLKANLDVLYRVAHPALPIRPGIVKVKTALASDSGRTVLANSITLTPGTMTVDITDDGYLYVHWINVAATDVEEATRRIVSTFERILARIFD